MIERPTLPDAIRATLPPVVQAYITALEQALETTVAALLTLSGEVATLQGRVAALEARLGQNSSNSSRPPSSDPPGARRPSPQEPGRRRPGGQPGHRGAFRVLLPGPQVTVTRRHVPPTCAQCGATLPAAARPDDPPDQRHQVVDVLPIPVQVTEHQRAARRCGQRGHLTRAGRPAGVPRGVGRTAARGDGGRAHRPLPAVQAGSGGVCG